MMKKIKYYILALFMGIIYLNACTPDSEFLEEVRKDALVLDNAYLSKSQMEMLLGSCYRTLQTFYNNADGYKNTINNGFGMDAMFRTTDPGEENWDWRNFNASSADSRDWFTYQWNMVKFANTVIAAAQAEGVQWNSEEEKKAIIAEGRFFRGFAYRNMAHIYGGVPIIDGPITAPKVDFVRDTREAVWEFAKEDFDYARQFLPEKTEKTGRVVKAAADHFLAELLICLGDNDGAIAAANRVINGDYHLMTTRFGTRASEPGRNAYWDLFRLGNQNYQAGNKEALLVTQFEYNQPGGTVVYGRPTIERTYWNRIWLYRKAGYTGTAPDSTGRGASFVNATEHVDKTIWKNMGSDVRGSEACIKRNFYTAAEVTFNGVTYPKGTLITKDNLLVAREDTMTYVYANWWKFGTDKHLDGRPDYGYVPDFYVARLAETYFLKAEALLNKGDKTGAAEALNVVRRRSNAPDVAPADVDLDYILDERLREIYGEEFRTLTLGRLGLIYERTKKYGSPLSAESIQPHNNLWPIPQSVLDRNTGYPMKQNPGYE